MTASGRKIERRIEFGMKSLAVIFTVQSGWKDVCKIRRILTYVSQFLSFCV